MTDTSELFALHEVQRAGRSIGTIHRPRTLDEALARLAVDPEARPLAGGTDLLLDLHRGGPGEAVDVVDLTGIAGFRSVTDDADAFVLAGGVVHNQVVAHRGLIADCLPLAQACLEVGSPQLRNRATVAGNLVTASPANDTISALMALDAAVEISRSDSGRVVSRTVSVADLFDGFRSTVLATGELITAIRVPKLGSGHRGLWVKLGLRRAQAISVVHAGLVVEFDGDTVSAARMAIGSVGPTVFVVPEFAASIVGRALDDETIATAAHACAEAVEPIDDVRATADYRRAGVAVIVERSLRTLAENRQAEMWPPQVPTLSPPKDLPQPAPVPDSEVTTTVTVTVNGTPVTAGGPHRSLLDWIRAEAETRADQSLTGVKEGCAEGECGACTVLMDDAAVMSCLVTAGQADGAEIVTVEGLAAGDQLAPIQSSFVDQAAVQCGFCIPGFLVAGDRLLSEIDAPTDEQIRLAFSGNLCRCTGYYPIIDAVRRSGVMES